MEIGHNVIVVHIREIPKDGVGWAIAKLYPRKEPLTYEEFERLRDEWECVLSEEDGLSIIEVYKRREGENGNESC